jgi:hypothetical protein
MAKTVSLSQQLRRRAKLAEQAAGLRRELDEIDADIFARFTRLASALEGESTPIQPYTLPPVPAAEQRGKGKAIIIPAVSALLRRSGFPLRTAELLTALTAAGITVGGKRPIGNLSAQLSLSELYTSVGGEWWFKGEQRPERNQAAHTNSNDVAA